MTALTPYSVLVGPLTPARRAPRFLTATLALSTGLIALAFIILPGVREAVADAALTWSAALAVISCLIARHRLRDGPDASPWGWLAGGCGVWLLGQVFWDYAEVAHHGAPGYPSLADIGLFGAYFCFVGAMVGLGRTRPHRRLDAELAIDLLMVTFTLTAFAYQFLFAPFFGAADGGAALATSVGWAAGGFAVCWLLLSEMVRQTAPLAGAAPVAIGLALFSVTNVLNGVFASTGAFPPYNLLDLGWIAGFLVMAGAAGRAVPLPRSVPSGNTPSPTLSAQPASRTIALLVSVAALMAVAISGALAGEASPATSTLIAVGGVIIVARFFYALNTEHRLAARLEQAVADQTHSLSAALDAASRAQQSLRHLMEAMPDVILVLDAAGVIVDSNLAGRPGIAGPGESLLGRNAFEMVPPDARALARPHFDAALEGSVRQFELPYTRPEQAARLFAILLAPVRAAGEAPRVIVLSRDVTEQRRTETQLQQAEKLAAMGQLVSGVAHEINNPAAIISGFAQTMLLDELSSDHREMAQMIYEEAGRIGQITQNLLAFARGGGRQRGLVDVNDVVRRTVVLREYHLSTRNIEVKLDLDDAEPTVWANRSQLQQTLLNLLINAEQALEGVTATRRIRCRTRGASDMVRIDVEDSGPGIPPGVRDRIFDPFFTTKTEGVGTGLGLSICYGIVREHGGRITANSIPEGGARFTVELPRDAREPAPAEASRASVPHAEPQPGPAVLLVEDEPALRRALSEYLLRQGIVVHAVAEGTAALAALTHRRFDVILSDVRMPGMGGREFVERLRRDHPETRPHLVFLTGDTLAPDTAALVAETGVPVMAKPLDFGALERLLRTVAQSGGATPRGAP